MVDSTVVNLALPELRRDLDASTSQLQWIPNAYLLTIAALVVTAGRLGDIYGRKRIFLMGMLVFGAGSILGGVAPTANVVIGARVLQGAGAAMILPLSLTLVTDTFPPADRGRAMGIWAAVSSVVLALGPVIGGVLAVIGWRLIFLANIPLAAGGYALASWAASNIRDPEASPRVDVRGVLLLGAGLAGLTLGLVEAEEWGS